MVAMSDPVQITIQLMWTGASSATTALARGRITATHSKTVKTWRIHPFMTRCLGQGLPLDQTRFAGCGDLPLAPSLSNTPA